MYESSCPIFPSFILSLLSTYQRFQSQNPKRITHFLIRQSVGFLGGNWAFVHKIKTNICWNCYNISIDKMAGVHFSTCWNSAAMWRYIVGEIALIMYPESQQSFFFFSFCQWSHCVCLEISERWTSGLYSNRPWEVKGC